MHGPGRCHVGDDLLDHPFLRHGGLERECPTDGVADGVGDRDPVRLGHPPAALVHELQAGLEQEELLEDHPPVGRRGAGVERRQGGGARGRFRSLDRGAVDLPQRGEPGTEAQPRRQRLGQRIGCGGHPRRHRVQQRPELAAGERAQLAVHRDHAPDVDGPFLVVGDDLVLRIAQLQAERAGVGVPLGPAEEDDVLAVMEHVAQVGLVEEDHVDRRRVVPDHQLEQLHPHARGGAGGRGDDAAEDAGRLALLQLGDAAERGAVLVAERGVEEQVAGGVDSLGGQGLRPLGAHPLHELDRCVPFRLRGHRQTSPPVSRRRRPGGLIIADFRRLTKAQSRPRAFVWDHAVYRHRLRLRSMASAMRFTINNGCGGPVFSRTTLADLARDHLRPRPASRLARRRVLLL